MHCRRPGHAGLEDGTLPFTAIAAARHGFRFLQRLGGFPAISRHAHSLAQHLAHSLIALRHPNGQPAAEVYGWGMAGAKAAVAGPGTMAGPTVTEARAEASCQGPTVAFNLLRADGSYVGYAEVRSLAALHGLHLRCGCFCNPGACAKFLNLKGAAPSFHMLVIAGLAHSCCSLFTLHWVNGMRHTLAGTVTGCEAIAQNHCPHCQCNAFALPLD